MKIDFKVDHQSDYNQTQEIHKKKWVVFHPHPYLNSTMIIFQDTRMSTLTQGQDIRQQSRLKITFMDTRSCLVMYVKAQGTKCDK
jgi:hypothetical protein